MPQYVVTARDGGDAGAPARRMAARPLHLEKIGPMVADGRIILGGALLDDAGLMIGSVLVVEFADRAGVDAWLAVEPYVLQGVWKDIEVAPFRVAVMAKS